MVTVEEIYGRDALRNGEPWIVPGALDMVKTLVKPEWEVFEWGSGGSTVFWSRNCKFCINVERNEIWVARTSRMMHEFDCPDNWIIKFIERDDEDTPPFKKYADVILAYPDEHFDLISVDGEASIRNRCIENSIAKLKVGGYLLLDNSNWYTDKTGWQKWEFAEHDLHWVGQTETFSWETTILRKG